MTIKVTKVSGGNSEQPISIHFEGDGGKPYKPGLSMRRVIVQLWGKFGNDYLQKSMTLYREPSVQWGGVPIGGIRISHMSDIDGETTLPLTVNSKTRKPYTVAPLQVATTPSVDYDAELKALEKAGDKGTAEMQSHWLSLDKSVQNALAGDKERIKEFAMKVDLAPDDDEIIT